MHKSNYNERSWAIDVISEINSIVFKGHNNILKAGGERTIKDDKKSLFPDVILFGNLSSTKIIQGWELKMPDTSISDDEFCRNATKKAEILKLNSFLLWNVNSAVLYIKRDSSDVFLIEKKWDSNRILRREEVLLNSVIWKNLLREIISDLENFFEKGVIQSRSSIEIFSNEKLVDVIVSNIHDSAEFLKKSCASESSIKAYIEDWWSSVESEHSFDKNNKDLKFQKYSEHNLLSWINRVLFCHYLKTYYPVAGKISNLSEISDVKNSIKLFEEIYSRCNFFNILHVNNHDIYISSDAWSQIRELNSLLSEIVFEDLDDSVRSNFLESIKSISNRKLKGQFATPKNLARLLVELCVDDKNAVVYDPCCGSGGIIKEVIDVKKESAIKTQDVVGSIWASDKFSIPVQITTLLLSQREFLGNVLNIFKSDILELNCNSSIELIDPNNGKKIIKKFPTPKYIVSNLPFIRQELIKKFNKKIQNKVSLNGKSDFFAYLPFAFLDFLDEEGSLGIIVSNSWLGTDWGKVFRNELKKFYNFEKIIISANVKWFQNADVISTIMILSKKNGKDDIDRSIDFIKINSNLNQLPDKDLRSLINSIILSKKSTDFFLSKRSKSDVEFFEKNGLGWNCFFEDLTWFKDVSVFLKPITEYLKIYRGERGGWNKLFYPKDVAMIDKDYLKPFIKSQKDLVLLVHEAKKFAFSCSHSEDDLRKKKKTKTLKWIQKFANENNKLGIPLTTSLQKSNCFWYEMKTDRLCDFVCGISPDKRLFITRLPKPSFVDQRLIAMKGIINSDDFAFLHALLNSILGLFYIEAMGFGRGLGVLDLSTSRFENDFRIFDMNLFCLEDKKKILNLFNPLLKRAPYELETELISEDRVSFDKAILNSLELEHHYEGIKNTLLFLYRRRKAA